MKENNLPIAIIGNGCAAVECCRALREHEYSGEIHLFAEGELPTYNPMLTSYYTAGKIPYEQLFPYGEHVFAQLDVTVHNNSPVTKLSAAALILAAQGLDRFAFSQCLIATGASVFLPRVPGIDSRRIYTMRTVEDAKRLRKFMAHPPKRALVVGASMVGIKVAELLHAAGVRVCLADMDSHVFPLAAHPDCAAVIERRLEEQGVNLRLSSPLERIEENDKDLLAWFGGSDHPERADILLMCIGVRANTSFINPGEIEVRQGVLVNEKMQTSVPGFYAAGDVSMGNNLLSGENQIIGLWANARRQGYTAGCNMAGSKTQYAGEIPCNITHFMGMDFVGIGDVLNYTDIGTWHSGSQFAYLFFRDGVLCGANTINMADKAGVLKNMMVKQLLHPQKQPDNVYSKPVQQHLFNELLQKVRGRLK